MQGVSALNWEGAFDAGKETTSSCVCYKIRDWPKATGRYFNLLSCVLQKPWVPAQQSKSSCLLEAFLLPTLGFKFTETRDRISIAISIPREV
jgi:hypothetical protein